MKQEKKRLKILLQKYRKKKINDELIDVSLKNLDSKRFNKKKYARQMQTVIVMLDKILK